MDPITHGLSGALLGKSYFSERHGRVVTFAVTLGALFPDVDVACELVSRDPLAIIRFHRGITHSFLGLPVFAVFLAGLTCWYQRRRGREVPSWPVLLAAYAVGLASHIVLDAMTSFGTRIWSPASRDRVAWDLLFIIDFALTAILALPQVVAWVYRKPDRSGLRAAGMWIIFSLGAFGVWRITNAAGFPFSLKVAVALVVALAALFFLPAWGGWGFRVSRQSWCRAGVCATIAYLAACGGAHHAAMGRVQNFAAQHHLAVERLGALPIPPSLLDWSGLIRVSDGVYRARFALWDPRPPRFEFLADSAHGPYVADAEDLPDVQLYLWFARFPLIRTSREGMLHIVEFSDMRFFGRRGQSSPPFTYRVAFDSDGRLVEEGWAVREMGLRFRLEERKSPRETP